MTPSRAVSAEDVLRGVAHDLLNPACSMDGFLKLMLDPGASDPLTPRQRRMLTTMERACTHFTGILKDLADYTRLEAEEQNPPRDPVDLAAAARTALEDHKAPVGRRAIGLVLNAPATLPPVPGDKLMLERFFDILLCAAGRTVREKGRISLTLEEDRAGGRVQGRLEHDGESRSAEAWKKDLSFSLADPRPPEGYAALGPALASRIAALHGGALDAAPRPGGGTVFHFSFPRMPPP